MNGNGGRSFQAIDKHQFNSMSSSSQKWVGSNRPPRVQITYDVEIGDAEEKKELPFVVGLLADVSGHPERSLPKLKERRFVEIDRNNFNEVMAKISPRLELSVPNTSTGDADLNVELKFQRFEDFHPEAIVAQVPHLNKLIAARRQLRDLLAKLDGNDDLSDLLQEVFQSRESLRMLKNEALNGLHPPPPDGENRSSRND